MEGRLREDGRKVEGGWEDGRMGSLLIESEKIGWEIDGAVGMLDGWIVGLLNDGMVGCLDGWMVERLEGWMFGWLDGWKVDEEKVRENDGRMG